MHIDDIHAIIDQYLTIGKVMLWSATKTLTLSLRASQLLSGYVALTMTRAQAQERFPRLEEGWVSVLNFVLVCSVSKKSSRGIIPFLATSH